MIFENGERFCLFIAYDVADNAFQTNVPFGFLAIMSDLNVIINVKITAMVFDELVECSDRRKPVSETF